MIRLYYAGGSIEVGDRVAESVMAYAHALADVGKSDLVTIPAVSDKGTRGTASLLIGPSSELMASPASDTDVDLSDDPLLESLRRKIAELQPPHPVSEDTHHSGGDEEF